MVLCSALEFGPHPGGSYGGQGGLSFYVGAKGRKWFWISHRKLNNSISHGVVILASEPDPMLIDSSNLEIPLVRGHSLTLSTSMYCQSS